MKAYKCDSCGKMIEDPHEEKIKEFCFYDEIDEHGIWKMPATRKVKIHLCGDCFTALHIIKKRIDITKESRPAVMSAAMSAAIGNNDRSRKES